MKTEPISLRFIGFSVALTLGVWLVANSIIFWVIYGDTIMPLTLPYMESFTTIQRLDYRQFGGKWHIQDQALVQDDTQLADLYAVVPLTLEEEQDYQFGAHLKVLSGPNGAGLLFNMQQQLEKRQSHLVRFGLDGDRAYLVFGYFDKDDLFVEQGAVPTPDISQGVDLAVIIHENFYDIMVNGQPQQRNVPLRYNGGRVALTTWFSSVRFDDVFITGAEEPFAAADLPPSANNTATAALTNSVPSSAPVITTTVPTTATPVTATPVTATPVTATVATTVTGNAGAGTAVLYRQNFAEPVDQSQWTTFSGDWRFEPGALVQQQSDGYDYSISYAGSFSQYTMRVRLRHRAGLAGGGLLFNMPNATDKLGGHLVRYYEGRALVWGYFDAQGNFVGQGDKAVDPPGDGIHTLQVISKGATYSILLDDVTVIENVPLQSQQGHIGLTASQSIVAFEEVNITPVQ